MKSPIHTLTMLFVFAALLSGCEKGLNEFNDAPYDSSQPISFTAETDMATRGTPINNAAELVSMGVFCAATGLDDWSGTATANKMFNERLNNNSGTWTYHNSDIYWGATDFTERYTFFAYTPYASIDNGITVTGSSSTQGKPTLTYTVPNDVTKQPDLMFAVPRYNIRPTGGKVALAMKHALTCVGFQIMGDGEQLTAISISGISVSGDIVMDGGNIAWTNLGSPTSTDFSASINYDMGEDYFTLPAVMTNLIAADGYLMMIPQQLGSNAKIKLTFKDNTVKEISLDNFTWEAGKRITYNVTVIPDGTITVTPDNVLLPYTAQNPAAQSLSVVCQKNDGSPNPSAQWTLTSSQSWLTLSLNSNGSAASATIAGTGSQTVYLVAGQNSATAPRTSALYLNGAVENPVANIIQNVNLNNIPGGGTSMLPQSFVGAFWRADERGERIIEIAHNGEWTAFVSWIDERWNEGDIVLDATPLTSNDYANRGITWNVSTENPDDAENWLVAGDAQLVSGTGKIFFRIGLKEKFSDLPSCNINNPDYKGSFPARYAVVVIKHNAGVQKLFLRQGHGADYVMRPQDAVNSGGYTNATRPSAVRFSPFNLTAPAGQINTQLDPQGGVPVAYPTQAGAFFQWANLFPGSIRYAWDTHNANAVGGNWTTATPYYWDTKGDIFETCPVGYRRPNDGTISAVNTVGAVDGSEFRQSLWLNPHAGMVLNVPNADNFVWGYYADGFFDRREISNAPSWESVPESAVSINSLNVAYQGALFFNPHNGASLFFPAPGSRISSAITEVGEAGQLVYTGYSGRYWSSSIHDTSVNPWQMSIHKEGAYHHWGAASTGFSIRCVKN